MIDFFREHIKIIIIAIIVIGIVITFCFFHKKKYNVEEYIKPVYNYFAMYSTEEKVGVIDKKGKIILEPIYDDVFIPNPSKPVFVCYENVSDYKFLDDSGKELYTNYSNVEVLQTSELNLDFEKTFLKFKKDEKYGLIDYNGNEIVQADYDSIESLKYRPGEILVKKDGKYGVIGSDGKIKIEIKYDSIIGDDFNTEKFGYGETGYIVGEKNDNGYLYGYLNNFGEKILDIKFESITRVLKYDDSNIYLIVMNNGKKGIYKNKKEIISQNYQVINYSDNSNVFVVKRNFKYGIFNVEGKEILPVNYVAYSLSGKYISVEEENGNKELYDVNGNSISNLNYKSIQSASDSQCYIVIDDNGYYSIITPSETISDNYTYISYAFDNNFIFKDENENYGLLNIYSGIVIQPQYAFMLVVDGKNAIEADTHDGNMDIYSRKIEKIFTLSGAIVENVDENYTMIYSNTEIRYINKDGDEVKNTEVFKDKKLYIYSENSKWGYKDKNGNVIVPAEYDFATELNEYGFAGIVRDGKWGVIDLNGEIIKEPTYEIDTYYLPEFIGEYLLELTDTYHCIQLQ